MKVTNFKYARTVWLAVSVALFAATSPVASAAAASGAGESDKIKPVAVQKASILQAEQWELARDGDSVLSIPVLNEVVNKWLMDTEKNIEIQYPGGEEGELWVHQLMDWLVALGIPSANLVAVPGSGDGDLIRLRVIRSGENFR